MSTVSLIGGAEGNLSKRADVPGKGAGDDVVMLLYESTIRNYNIYTLGGADRVDTLKSNVKNFNSAILGSGNDSFTGGAASDTVYDGSGVDTVRLGKGVDMIRAGAGNDIYDGGAGADYISFDLLSYDGEGFSALNFVGMKCDLAIATRQNFGSFGKDIILNFENAEGGSGDDVLYGTKFNNALYGKDGNDRLAGRAGNDKLIGGHGDDVLSGGAGKDTLLGAEGVDLINCGAGDQARDIVRYTGKTESLAGLTTRDTIFAFQAGAGAADDRIDLSVFSKAPAQAGLGKLQFIGNKNFSLPGGEVRVVVQGGDSIVQIDLDSSRAAEMHILVKGVTDLSAVDFIL